MKRSEKEESIGDLAARVLANIPVASDDEVAAAREADAQRRRAEEQAQAIARLKAASVPARVIEAAIAADDRASAVAGVARWDKERNIVILAGNTGVGKTTAAAWWLARHGGTAPFFLRAAELEARGRYDLDLRKLWIGASGMVLDDLGVEYKDAKGNLATALDELVDVYAGRYAGLIITTNMTKDDFTDRYSERVTSRLHERGRWHNVQGEDRRRT